MILFCVDQVAGAEYILPLVSRWRQRGFLDWRICATPRSYAFLQMQNVSAMLVTGDINETVDNIIETLRPQLAVMSSSTHSPFEATFRQRLRQADVRCVQFIDMWVNYVVRFQDVSGQLDLPDVLLTLDDNARQAMVQEGLPEARIVVVGQPYFEARYQALQNETEVDASSGRALLVTQPISKYIGKQLGYDETDFLAGVLQAWRSSRHEWTQLDVIVHPEESRQHYRAVLDRYSSDINIVENTGLNLKNYSLMIGMYSSMMIHAMLSQTRAVSFQPGAQGADACHLSAQGIIERFTQIDELANFLGRDLRDFRRQSASPTPLLSAIQGSCDRLENFLLNKP